MTMSRLLYVLPALCLAACAGSDDGSSSSSQAAAESMSADPVGLKRVKSGDFGDDDFGKIAKKYGSDSPYAKKDGKPMGEYKEFTGFDRDNPEFKNKWDKEYKAGDFKKKSWWGDKDYAKKVYAGDTDANSLKKESVWGKKNAGEASKLAREAGDSYGTKDYATGRAREEGGDGIRKISDAETDERRRVFTSPDVIPWKAQGLTVEDTNRMMGR
ncbi:hypothetical protein OJ996_18370 [Luteolibacter sp. GHJ8]|uniref:Lipoprotein n=1 Tax=Luteolibacter rhizosphaerae TaxID=2989719 RepID=A0ABT3G6U0_9BACT|nr:hypothetical protein [Luteolibacter rhizosphaerae]MCW1915558.1 hypothetical protein [Luteolibacter rhizosphaerae]